MQVARGVRRRVLILLIGIASTSTLIMGTAQAQVRPPPPGSYQAQIVDRFTNSVGFEVLYRRGYWHVEDFNGGFGYDKAYNKHNLRNKDVVGAVVHSPDRVNRLFNLRWNHRKYVSLNFCSLGSCTKVDETTVLGAIEYGPLLIGAANYGQMGVVTAFCEENPPVVRCPEWINLINVERSSAGDPLVATTDDPAYVERYAR